MMSRAHILPWVRLSLNHQRQVRAQRITCQCFSLLDSSCILPTSPEKVIAIFEDMNFLPLGADCHKLSAKCVLYLMEQNVQAFMLSSFTFI